MQVKHIVVSVLLLAGAACALAESPGFGRGGRDAVRAYHVQNIALERGETRGDAAPQGQTPQQGERQRGGQDSSGYAQSNEDRGNGAGDNGRRPGRMSPEERRALRRQIDEVGHDIYAPKR